MATFRQLSLRLPLAVATFELGLAVAVGIVAEVVAPSQDQMEAIPGS